MAVGHRALISAFLASMRRMAQPRALLALTLAASLGGCGLFADDPPPCPGVSVPAQARTVTLYREGPGRDLVDVAFEVTLVDVVWRCAYDFNDEGDAVNVDLAVVFEATRGPAAETASVSVPFFVAITDPSRRIIAKKVFVSELVLDETEPRVRVAEEIEERIPIAAGTAGPGYLTHVGLQLSPAQLEDARRLGTL